MSKSVYLAYLRRRLLKLESEINDERKRLERGSLREKVDAAGELSYLDTRFAEIRTKIARLEAEPEGLWENIKTAVEQNLDSIESALSRWSSRQGHAFAAPRDADGKTDGTC